MKIFIDIGHPAHVHYFKNLIEIMRGKGHDFFISARAKDCTLELLERYDLDYYNRGAGSPSLVGKFFYLVKADLELYRVARKYQPDLFLSFGSSYAAHVSKLLRRPHIAFDDTEHAVLEHMLYVPFTDMVCTPHTFKKNFGEKQIRFKGSMELCYLHPNYFKPNPDIRKRLGLGNDERYVVMRFVSWGASHDRGHQGLTNDDKMRAVNEISKFARVLISSEEELSSEMKPYQIRVPVDQIHHVLYHAELYFGDGGTMAAESSILGTPAINVATSATLIGGFKDLESFGLMYIIPEAKAAIDKACSLLAQPDLRQVSQAARKKMLSKRIDVTKFMIWLVENYPGSMDKARQEAFLIENFKIERGQRNGVQAEYTDSLSTYG